MLGLHQHLGQHKGKTMSSLFSKKIENIADGADIDIQALKKQVGEAKLNKLWLQQALIFWRLTQNENRGSESNLKQLIDTIRSSNRRFNIRYAPKASFTWQLISNNLGQIMNWFKDERSISLKSKNGNDDPAILNLLQRHESNIRKMVPMYSIEKHVQNMLLHGISVICSSQYDEVWTVPLDTVSFDYTNRNFISIKRTFPKDLMKDLGFSVDDDDRDAIEVDYGNYRKDSKWFEFIIYDEEILEGELEYKTLHWQIYDSDPETGSPVGVYEMIEPQEFEKIKTDQAIMSRRTEASSAGIIINQSLMDQRKVSSLYNNNIVGVQANGDGNIQGSVMFPPSRIGEMEVFATDLDRLYQEVIVITGLKKMTAPNINTPLINAKSATESALDYMDSSQKLRDIIDNLNDIAADVYNSLLNRFVVNETTGQLVQNPLQLMAERVQNPIDNDILMKGYDEYIAMAMQVLQVDPQGLILGGIVSVSKLRMAYLKKYACYKMGDEFFEEGLKTIELNQAIAQKLAEADADANLVLAQAEVAKAEAENKNAETKAIDVGTKIDLANHNIDRERGMLVLEAAKIATKDGVLNEAMLDILIAKAMGSRGEEPVVIEEAIIEPIQPVQPILNEAALESGPVPIDEAVGEAEAELAISQLLGGNV